METNESTNFLIKLGIYIAGVTIGLLSKLAIMRNERKITVWEAVMHSLTAFACAWIVWNLMNHYHAEDWAKNGVSVIVGRYGDYILLAIWKAFKIAINAKDKKVL